MEANRSHKKVIASANGRLVENGLPLLNGLDGEKPKVREAQSLFRKNRTILFAYFPLALLLSAISTLVFAQLDLQYQRRGDRYEGVKPKPVSGSDIELLSVLADYQEAMVDSRFPDIVKVRFYLDKQQSVAITVRELDYRTYYWLQNAERKKVWPAGFGNEFVWPTDPVLKQLTPSVQLYELGVLIRLGRETASSIERVAPAILYASNPPSRVDGYRFTLKTREDARLKCSVIPENKDEAVFTRIYRRVRAGRPFTVYWKTNNAAPGAYRMEISGFSLSTDHSISKEISFYHQPSLTR